MVDGADRGRRAFEAQAWGETHAALSRGADAGLLDADDLERLAVAAYLIGRDDDAARAWEQAHREWLGRDEIDHAARCAFWLGFNHLLAGDTARASGWFERAHRVIADTDVAARGYLLIPEAMDALERGDTTHSGALYEQVEAIADRFDDADLAAIARLGRGEVAVAVGDMRSGLALLDEVMVAATTGEVSPVTTGILYCAVIDACMHAFDLRRAAEWTEALGRWCAASDVVPFRGECLVHRSQVLQAHGEWSGALAAAREAHGLLAASLHPAVGAAHYQRAELHRLRGDLGSAAADYELASRHGCEPTPGLALLRLAEGRIPAAATTIRRMRAEAHPPARHVAVLGAFVEIMLAADDDVAASEGADDLRRIAADTGAPLVAAHADHATGAVALARDEPVQALDALRRACATWRSLGLPYHWARSRELVGRACRDMGDADAGDLELVSARAELERIGARPDVARVDALLAAPDHPRPNATPLTTRECDVLRLVAAGRTNREIGAELVISEHTAARHVQNIFAKLGVSSRVAATAYAYEHDLV